MDATIFRAALRASAKVALGATMTSCGGSIHAGAQGDAPDAVADAWMDASRGDEPVLADAPPTEDALAEQDVHGGSTCDPPAASTLIPEQSHPGVGIGDGLFDCCASMIGSKLFRDGAPQGAPDAAASDPRILGCCAVVVYRLDAEQDDAGATLPDQGTLQRAGIAYYTDLIPACCEPLQTWYGICTPWGPPMPPAMPEVA
jgi:hypothetical protein